MLFIANFSKLLSDFKSLPNFLYLYSCAILEAFFDILSGQVPSEDTLDGDSCMMLNFLPIGVIVLHLYFCFILQRRLARMVGIQTQSFLSFGYVYDVTLFVLCF
jgi:hypothetical protein